MDLLLSLVAAFVFLLLFLVTLAKSRRYKALITPAIFYATLIFFVAFFGGMMLAYYFPVYVHFFNFVKEVIYVPPLFIFFLFYALCFFYLLFHSEKN